MSAVAEEREEGWLATASFVLHDVGKTLYLRRLLCVDFGGSGRPEI